MKTLIPILLAAILAACSPLPDAIAPAPMTGLADGLSCSVARSRLATERARYAELAQLQRNAATADAIGVFIAFVPFGNLTGGNKEGLIAESKGTIDAYEARLMTCQSR